MAINNNKYISIIGLEVHAELKTNSKMFCGCRNDPFHAAKPNIYTCPVCLGLPGALPAPNKNAIEMAVMLGLALGCRVNKESRFDRKHYFYPDLPKGYQISQYEKPFCEEGIINIASLDPSTSLGMTKGIRIRRVHLEEDTGKLIHRKINGENVSLVDFNRSGVPLVEIVTEPDIRSAEEAKEAARKIQRIVRFLGISDADMEKGSMRLEANVSLLKGRTLGTQGPTLRLPNYKVELKNINSFRFLERAIKQEIDRQKKILSLNKAVKQQTFGWDSEKMELKPQRVKEEAADYRYFPEPDIPPIRLSADWISKIKNQISKMSDEIYEELIESGVSRQAAEVISSKKAVAEKIINIKYQISNIKNTNQKSKIDIARLANWILHHQKDAEELSADRIAARFTDSISDFVADEGQLAKWAEAAVAENPKAVADYKKGKEAALQFLIGQVQRRARGKAEVGKVKKILTNQLKDSG